VAALITHKFREATFLFGTPEESVKRIDLVACRITPHNQTICVNARKIQLPLFADAIVEFT
jgi:hypothetical protein